MPVGWLDIYITYGVPRERERETRKHSCMQILVFDNEVHTLGLALKRRPPPTKQPMPPSSHIVF
jgi:hypothetical protein